MYESEGWCGTAGSESYCPGRYARTRKFEAAAARASQRNGGFRSLRLKKEYM